MELMRITNGAVLELGSGLYSTVYLHWACFDKKRKLLTLESKPEYVSMMKNLRADYHEIRLVEDWAKADLSGEWSVVLVDHSPGKRRPYEALRLLDAEYVVLHDTEEVAGKDYYRYKDSGVFEKFKYRFDYKGLIPNTTVLSNKHDLKGLNEALNRHTCP